MTTPITPLKAWLAAATTAERDALAQRVGTSSQYLAHLAVDDDRTYKREPKPRLAAAIERETKALNISTAGRLPVVWRTDLVSACRDCDFARRCVGEEQIMRSHFPIAKG